MNIHIKVGENNSIYIIYVQIRVRSLDIISTDILQDCIYMATLSIYKNDQ